MSLAVFVGQNHRRLREPAGRAEFINRSKSELQPFHDLAGTTGCFIHRRRPGDRENPSGSRLPPKNPSSSSPCRRNQQVTRLSPQEAAPFHSISLQGAACCCVAETAGFALGLRPFGGVINIVPSCRKNSSRWSRKRPSACCKCCGYAGDLPKTRDAGACWFFMHIVTALPVSSIAGMVVADGDR